MIKGKVVYFTKCAAIVLFIIIAGCVSTQPHATLHPISVVSVEAGCALADNGDCIPSGPAFTLTLNASSTNVPVTHLSAMLMLTDGQTHSPISFTFPNINQSNPLMPGQTASENSGAMVGPVYVLSINGTAAVFIEGMLQNGQSFSYWTNDTTS